MYFTEQITSNKKIIILEISKKIKYFYTYLITEDNFEELNFKDGKEVSHEIWKAFCISGRRIEDDSISLALLN